MTGLGQNQPPGQNQPNQPLPGNQAGIGAGTNATGTGVPPASHINTSNNTAHSGGGSRRLEAKAEKAMGSLVGSQALKERGFQKEQEAGAFKTQSQALKLASRRTWNFSSRPFKYRLETETAAPYLISSPTSLFAATPVVASPAGLLSSTHTTSIFLMRLWSTPLSLPWARLLTTL